MERVTFCAGNDYIPPVKIQNDYEYMGSFRGLNVYDTTDGLRDHIYVLEPNLNSRRKFRVVASLEFVPPERNEDTRQVEMVWVQKMYAKQNIAVDLYTFLMRKHGMIIQAGNVHTQYGERLWRQLANQQGVQLCAATRRGLVWLDRPDTIEEDLAVGGRSVYRPGVALFAQWVGR